MSGLNVSAVPASLRALPQWVCWKLQPGPKGRITKAPYAATSGAMASSTDPATWSPFEEAVAAFEKGGYEGVGFVFDENGIVGVDLDHCLKEGALHLDAERIVRSLNSYTEISPSGDGLHVLLKGRKTTTACSKPKMPWGGECALYEKARFFVVTGKRFQGYPAELECRQDELESLCRTLWPKRVPASLDAINKVHALNAQGLTVRQIANTTGLSLGCISNYLKTPPEPGREQPSIQREQAVSVSVNTPDLSVNTSDLSVNKAQMSVNKIPVHAEMGSVEREHRSVHARVHAENSPVHAENSRVHAQFVHAEKNAPCELHDAPSFTDEEIVELAKSSRSGAKFLDLWQGRWTNPAYRYNSPSEADSSLVFKLAYYTKDPAQLDRLFRASGLMREKWDELRGEETYGQKTIRKALEIVREQYRGKGRKSGTKAADALRAGQVVSPTSREAHELLERARTLVEHLRGSPDVTQLATAIAEYLWRLPDIFLDELKPGLAEALKGVFKSTSFDRAIKEARVAHGQVRQKEAAARRKQESATSAALRNYETFLGVDTEGNPKEFKRALPIAHIGANLQRLTDAWPRRVDALLFTEEEENVRYLEDRDQLFAWIMEHAPVFWTGGQDSNGQSLVTKAEFMAHLQAVVRNYEAVEMFPHEPPLPRHYYFWKAPDGYKPTGEFLQRLLDYFDNAETIEDLLLIKAAFMTPAWGGPPGRRPAFVILAPDRGCGKSTLANVIGQLYGEYIELSLTDTAEDKLMSRVLTPSALTKRVVRIDNIKNSYNSAFIEAMITSPTLSGHRLYYGDASRPNTLTFLMTGNALRLSRDVAERSFIIRLQMPKYRPDWESAVGKFVTEHRVRILADIVAELKAPSQPFTETDRYADWLQGVLSRCRGPVDDVVRLNRDRRNECDEDQDEASTIMGAIDESLETNSVANDWVFVSTTQMAEIVTNALSEPTSAKSVKAKMQSHIEAGRLPRVRSKRTSAANGFMVQRPRVKA